MTPVSRLPRIARLRHGDEIAHRIVDNRDYSRAMSLDLFAQHCLVRPSSERHDFVSPARSGHHFERLSADRAGAAGYGNLDGHD